MKHKYTRCIIAGSRTFEDYQILKHQCKKLLEKLKHVQIICGGAKGTDALAIQFAKEYQYELVVVPPDWKTFQNAAGFVRNAAMVEYSDMLIAFWDGRSSGTKHIIDLAQLRGLEVYVFRV